MIVGILLIVTNASVAVWGYVAYRRNAPPGDTFKQVLALSQTVVVAQATLGLVLVSDGLRPADVDVADASRQRGPGDGAAATQACVLARAA